MSTCLPMAGTSLFATDEEIGAQPDLTLSATQLYAVLHRRTFNRLFATFPFLAMKPRLVALLCYILYGPRDPETERVPLAAKIVSRLYQRGPRRARNHRVTVLKDIRTLQDAIPGLKIRLSPFDRAEGITRQVCGMTIPPQLEDILFEDEGDLFGRKGLVDTVTGRALTSTELKEHLEWRRRTVNRLNAENSDLLPEQREFLDYLNNTVNERFFHFSDEARKQCFNYIRDLDPEKRVAAMANFKFIMLQPQTLYKGAKHSARLFAHGYGLSTIDRNLRQLLMPQLYELDLACAHVAIFASVCEIKVVQDFLTGGGKFWKHILTALGFDPNDQEMKDALKPEVYAIIYGGRLHNLFKRRHRHDGRLRKDHLSREARSRLTPELRERFLQIDLIKALVEGRDTALTMINTNGGMLDAYDRWISILGHDESDDRGGVSAKSVLSQVCQSYEYLLLEPVRRLAMDAAGHQGAFHILIWQHDGCSISIPRERDVERTIQTLTEAVHKQAERLNIPTALEIKAVSQNRGRETSEAPRGHEEDPGDPKPLAWDLRN